MIVLLTEWTPLMLSSLVAMGENFALQSSGRLISWFLLVLHCKTLPLSLRGVRISPACKVLLLLLLLMTKLSRTNTRMFRLRESSKTFSNDRVAFPSSDKSSKNPPYVSGMRIFEPKLYEIINFYCQTPSTSSPLPMFVVFLPSLIFIGCAMIWNFLPALRNKAVDWRLGFDSVGTPRFKCWPFMIFATTGISIFEKSLINNELLAKLFTWSSPIEC